MRVDSRKESRQWKGESTVTTEGDSGKGRGQQKLKV